MVAEMTLAPGISLHLGHVLDVLRQLPDESIQCCITSPPFYGLRTYGLPPQVWGGDPLCSHIWGEPVHIHRTVGGAWEEGSHDGKTGRGSRATGSSSAFCLRCGAWLGCLGLEPTPELHVEHLVLVFREVWRALRPDGTLWLNEGDSYNGSGGAGGDYAEGGLREGQPKFPGRRVSGLKNKDLIGIPWLVAFALRKDGWYLRRDFQWVKRNPMPESVRDRPNVAHETWFLFSKSGDPTFWTHRDLPGTRTRPSPDYRWIHKVTGYEVDQEPEGWRKKGAGWRRVNLWSAHDYFYDYQAVRQPGTTQSAAALSWNRKEKHSTLLVPGQNNPQHRPDREPAAPKQDGHGHRHAGFNQRWDGAEEAGTVQSGRNRRTSDWWYESLEAILSSSGLLLDDEGLPLGLMVNPKPYPGAHFACVDGGTECLTVDGWKKHEDLEPGTLAAQFDTQTGLLSWASIEDIARYQVDNQSMVTARSRNVELLLTPDHRTIISRRHNVTRKWQSWTIIRADELKPSHAIPVSGDWEGNWQSPVSEDWAELIGWYITEGCETVHPWTVEIYQCETVNAGKVDRIRLLLNSVGADFSEARAVREWRGEERVQVAFQIRGFAAVFLRQWAPNKTFRPSVLTWSDELLQRMLDALIGGDGHQRPDGRMSFIQRSKYSADMAQAIGTRLGYSTKLSRRSEGTYVVYFTRKRLISFRGTAGEGAEITSQLYSGIVWCPKLPKGTWVARKAGRVFFTGNTFPPGVVVPCALAGTPPQACPVCGAPWWQTAQMVSSWREGALDVAQTYSDVTRRARPHSGGMSQNQYDPGVWVPTCSCPGNNGSGRSLILDPFSGSGTVLHVAHQLNRHAIGIELNPQYAYLAKLRFQDQKAAP